jgi:hypothetical protein
VKKTLTRDTLLEILDDAGLKPEEVVYDWPYGMYDGYGGHRSFAMKLTDEELAKFYMALGAIISYATFGEAPRTYPEGLANLSSLLPSGTDSLGLGTVTYFRGWELEPEEEEEE